MEPDSWSFTMDNDHYQEYMDIAEQFIRFSIDIFSKFEANADFNASINISRASINKPIVTAAELQTSRSLA